MENIFVIVVALLVITVLVLIKAAVIYWTWNYLIASEKIPKVKFKLCVGVGLILTLFLP